MSQPPEETPETAAGTLPAADLPYHGSDPWLHNVCVAAAILAPVGLLLPPRRMGPRSLLLAAGTFFATSQLTYDYTGHSLFARFQQRANQVTTSDLPEAAVRRQAAMRAERERRQQQQQKAEAESEGRLHKLWMGNEKADWSKERARREKEVLDAGGGYWELIMEQIGDVWTDLRKKNPGDSQDESQSTSAPSATPNGPAKR